MPDLTIVLPCLNEAATLASCIRKARQSIDALGLDSEIIVADNGSTDGSAAIAATLGATVVHVPDKGYGNALRGGIAAATGRWILMGDADDSYDFGHIAPFVDKLREGYDLVMGCRLPRGGGTIRHGAMPWTHRWIGNPVLSGLGRLLFGSRVTDFHCGMRAFTRDAYHRIDLKTTGMEFASEMVIKATLQGLRIGEIPITLSKDGRRRPPHLRSWRDGWRHLRFMLLFSPNWLFIFPGLLLFLVGTLVGARLQFGSWTVWIFGFDTNTLLACTMCQVVGLQILTFGIFTRVFAATEGLVPKGDSLLEKYAGHCTLERGILLGLLIFLVGLARLIFAFLAWKAAHFGPLSYPDSLRQVIPAVTWITIGVQIVFTSFFLSILGIPKK